MVKKKTLRLLDKQAKVSIIAKNESNRGYKIDIRAYTNDLDFIIQALLRLQGSVFAIFGGFYSIWMTRVSG